MSSRRYSKQSFIYKRRYKQPRILVIPMRKPRPPQDETEFQELNDRIRAEYERLVASK